jgi:hypothetical protein
MWKGRELLGTVFVRWRRKHESGSLVFAGYYPGFVYATSLLSLCLKLRIYLCHVIMECLVGEEPTTLVQIYLNRLADQLIDFVVSFVEQTSEF